MTVGLWQQCIEELKYIVPDNIFTMWIRPLSAVEQDNTLTIIVPNEYFATYVKKNHLIQIQTILKKLSPEQEIDIQIRIDKVITDKIASNGLSDLAIPTSDLTASKNSPTSQPNTIATFSPNLNPDFTFEQFVTGKSNQIAYGVCKETAQHLGSVKHNPLFLYGATGLGKTHLMQAVGHEIIKQQKSFYYFTSDKFVNQLVNAIQQNKVDEFKTKIKKADLLIIDDIHVIAGKRKTSLEFLDLFNELFSKNKQIILASDRHPNALTELDDSIKSRVSGGLSVALEPPELDMRMQILQKKAKIIGINLPKECALFIAQHVVANVRELEGALNKVVAISRLLNQEIALDLVQMALKDVIAIRVQAVSMDNIRKVVAEYYDVSVKDIMGKKRARHIARPRQVAMALAREFTNNSYPEIGQSFGGRDHTTVMHACEKVQELCIGDPVFEKQFQALRMMLQS